MREAQIARIIYDKCDERQRKKISLNKNKATEPEGERYILDHMKKSEKGYKRRTATG